MRAISLSFWSIATCLLFSFQCKPFFPNLCITFLLPINGLHIEVHTIDWMILYFFFSRYTFLFSFFSLSLPPHWMNERKKKRRHRRRDTMKIIHVILLMDAFVMCAFSRIYFFFVFKEKKMKFSSLFTKEKSARAEKKNEIKLRNYTIRRADKNKNAFAMDIMCVWMFTSIKMFWRKSITVENWIIKCALFFPFIFVFFQLMPKWII